MKIIEVLNTMITNENKINNVIRRDREYYFIYDNKYKWSISKSQFDDEYFIHLYPVKDLDIEQIANISDWGSFSNFVTYSTRDIKTQEATETFAELYRIVSAKLFGIDNIFNDIING